MNFIVTVLTHVAAAIAGGFIYKNNPLKAKLTLDQLTAQYNAEVAKLKGEN